MLTFICVHSCLQDLVHSKTINTKPTQNTNTRETDIMRFGHPPLDSYSMTIILKVNNFHKSSIFSLFFLYHLETKKSLTISMA